MLTDEEDRELENGAVADLVADGVPQARAERIASDGARIGSELMMVALSVLDDDEPPTLLSIVNAVDALSEDQCRSVLVAHSLMLADYVSSSTTAITVVLGGIDD